MKWRWGGYYRNEARKRWPDERKKWHKWYAWRPVGIPEQGGIVEAHKVWFDYGLA